MSENQTWPQRIVSSGMSGSPGDPSVWAGLASPILKPLNPRPLCMGHVYCLLEPPPTGGRVRNIIELINYSNYTLLLLLHSLLARTITTVPDI